MIIHNSQLSITFSNSQPKEIMYPQTTCKSVMQRKSSQCEQQRESVVEVVSLMHAVWSGPQAIRKNNRGEHFVDEESKVCVCVWWLLARSSRVMEQLICWLTPVSLRTLLPVQPLHYFYFYYGHTNRDLQPPTALCHCIKGTRQESETKGQSHHTL